MESSKVRVRFAPSPTGFLHVAGARTALYNWLFARQTNGRFILRIEDTDRTRFEPDAVPSLLSGLRWLGLFWDEGPEVGGEYGPYYQTDRAAIYQEYATKLVSDGKAYRCYCSPERLAQVREQQRVAKLPPGYDRHCRQLTRQQAEDYEAQGIKPVVRLAIPTDGVTEFDDLLHGHISVDNRQLDDLVLLKSDGLPTYHLAVVVDDHLMSITHVLRGDEWLSSVPKHVLLYNALGWEMPVLVHLPLILDPSGTGKLSKRKKKPVDGRETLTFVSEFQDAGYLPEAMVNFLALVGWAYDGKTEFFGRDQLVRCFDLHKVSRAPAAFSYDKLDYMNATYVRGLGANDLAGRLMPFIRRAGLQPDYETVLALVPLLRERIKTLNEVVPWVDYAFQNVLDYDSSALIQKGMDAPGVRGALQASSEAMAAVPQFDDASLEAVLRPVADQLGLKPAQYFGCLRVACTGRAVSPPLFGVLRILGRERVLQRVDEAVQRLSQH